MRTIRILHVLFSLLLTALFASVVQAEVQVVADTPSNLILEVNFQDWTSVTFDDGVLHMPTNAGVDDRTGGELTPFVARLIGLPSNQRPRVTIESVQWGERLVGRAPQGTEPTDHLEVDHLSGQGPVVVGEPFEWRRHWVSYLYLVPVQQDGNGVRPLKSMRLRVDYGSPTETVLSSSDPLVHAALANPSAAGRWQRSLRTIKQNSKVASTDEWPSGTMIRIELDREGMYELTPEDLDLWGIDLSGLDPRNFRIFNNGGQPLPEDFDDPRDTELRENAIIVTGEEDGSFDDEDRIIFFGRAVNTWIPGSPPGEYRHRINAFTRVNVYWLNIADDGSQGLRMADLNVDESPTYNTDRARTRMFIDNESVIFNNSSHIESGKDWYARELFSGEIYAESFNLSSPLADESATLWVSLKTLGGANNATILVNGTPVDVFNSSVTTWSIELEPGVLRDGNNTFTFQMNNGHLYFNWFEIHYERRLNASNGRIDFDTLPEDGIAQVTLTGLEEPWVFDIEDFDEVSYTREIPFKVETQVNSPRRHIAVSTDNFLTPIRMRVDGIGQPDYPNGLRDTSLEADYIILTHEDFYDNTARLETFIEQRDTIEVLRVDVADVYREFAWGMFDPTAIRDFLAFTHDNWAVMPQSVLLVGDGDYDYRNIISNSDDNWIPPYEENTDCRDDWYTTFDNGVAQMALGRLTIQTNRALDTYIDKLIAYEADTDPGPWRSRMVLLADDEYVDVGPTSWDTAHMEQAEDFSRNYAPDYLNINKIYIGTYPTSYDPVSGGRRKPAANRDLIEQINAGALLVSFIGHGNAHTWTHESVLTDSRDGSLINSGTRNPIYIAATCSWGHFDRPDNQSHPELLLEQSGGAIGVIAATRKTNGFNNFDFALAFYSRLFDRVNNFPLGTSLYLAKMDAPLGSNRYYHCLGEPHLTPALPRLDMNVEEVNPDSLQALAHASVRGTVQIPSLAAANKQQGDNFRTERGISATTAADFDGETLVTVYDSDDTLSYTFTNRNGTTGSTLDYYVKGGTLFRGNVTTTGGEFTANFMVPRDVKFGSNAGSIQMYCYNDEQDGVGTMRDLAISVNSADLNDATPPELRIRFDHENWMSGDLTSSQPTLYLDVFDTNGVNLTGEIGHDIRAIIDGTRELVLTEGFIYNRDSFTRGTAEQPIYDLEPGRHRIEAWAWDNANNFTRTEASFVVVDPNDEVQLENVLNFPNPFNDRTSFTFELSTEAEVSIRIFTASGRLIQEIGPVAASAGFNYPGGTNSHLEWDGRDRFGDPIANGVYLYKIKAKGASGQTDEVLGKLLRIR
ncbi:type IX secretion system sortase PorU [bacterium]|nr:type IX secretion system sortase PorU [bacterium]